MQIDNKIMEQLIDIIAGHKYDAEAIALGLAKVGPELFIKLATPAEKVPDVYVQLARSVRILMDARQPVDAIRTIRNFAEKSGVYLGLYEAKLIIDNLRYMFHSDWFHEIDSEVPDIPDNISFQAKPVRAIYKHLVESYND